MKARLPEEYTSKGVNNMIKQAQKMQEDMAVMQDELKSREYSAAAGGGMASATVNGDHELLALDIKPDIVDADDTEMMAEIIIAAVNAANQKAREDSDSEMEKITGGMALPGLG